MACKYHNHFQFLSWIKDNCTVDSIYATFIVLTILKFNGARRSFAKSNEAKINPTWLSPSACFVAIVLKNGNGNEFAAYPNRFTSSSVNKNKILLCPAIFSSVFFNAFAVLEESIAATEVFADCCRCLETAYEDEYIITSTSISVLVDYMYIIHTSTYIIQYQKIYVLIYHGDVYWFYELAFDLNC